MAWSENSKGAALMVGAMMAYALNDACVRFLALGEVPFFQAMFLRGVGTSVLLALVTAGAGQMRFAGSRRDWGRIFLRGLAEVAAAFLFLNALYNMPLSNAVAIMQALPLTVALGAALILGEPLGWRRMSAIGVGLVGVMLIVQPGGEGFNIYALSALGAVAAVTLRDLVARRLTPQVPSMMVALVASVLVTLAFGIGAAVTPWTAVGARDWLFMGAAVVFILVGYVLSVAVMRVGDVGAVAPFRYSALLMGIVLGVTFFGERPNGLMLLGAAIVMGAGLFTLWRERQLARRG